MEMKRLTLDELQIQSFSTAGENAAGRGTVRAHESATDEAACPPDTWDTSSQSCIESCRYSCICNGTDPADYTVDCTVWHHNPSEC
jgi:hypothetical protein